MSRFWDILAEVKPVAWHPKALEFVRMQSTAIRKEVGEALRNLQKGMSLGMPQSRPMPSVGIGVHELRVKDEDHAVRIFYLAKMRDAIVVFHGFEKKGQQTKTKEIWSGRQRLKEMIQ